MILVGGLPQFRKKGLSGYGHAAPVVGLRDALSGGGEGDASYVPGAVHAVAVDPSRRQGFVVRLDRCSCPRRALGAPLMTFAPASQVVVQGVNSRPSRSEARYFHADPVRATPVPDPRARRQPWHLAGHGPRLPAHASY